MATQRLAIQLIILGADYKDARTVAIVMDIDTKTIEYTEAFHNTEDAMLATQMFISIKLVSLDDNNDISVGVGETMKIGLKIDVSDYAEKEQADAGEKKK